MSAHHPAARTNNCGITKFVDPNTLDCVKIQ